MPVRRAAPSSKPSPKPSGYAENEPTREALLAALAEAREQQAAVAEVLEVINGSPGDLPAAFDAIVEKGGRLCDATNSGLWLVEDGTARLASLHSGKAKAPKPLLASVPAADLLGRRDKDQPFLHIEDLKATKAYRQGVPLIVASVDVEGVRTCLVTPLHDGERIVGAFVLTRDQVRPFADRQIALAQAFAGQAQIAMKNARLLNETQAALARQTATAEILRVISQSPTDARPVFELIVVTAARLLGCDMAFVLLRDGDAYVHTAGATPEGPMADLAPERIPIDPNANFPSRAFLARTMLHLPDWSQIDLPEHERRIHEMFGVNSVLYLPLLRGDECIGLLAVGGKRANIFGPSEIAQAESFRDQALIAMENARLFNETQEALERQTATAEVLKVIASSPSEVQPVFDAIAASANRLLGGFSTTVIRFVGDALHLVAFTPTNAAADEALQAAFPRPIADFPPFILVRDGETQQFIDTEAESGVPPVIRELARLRGYRSMLFTPLMSKDGAIGMISVTRKEPGAFAADDVALLRTFADQAVIAIQNARLFNETQEALERQTATANVLKVISRSVSDAAPVFETILESCQRLFGLEAVAVYLVEGDMVKGVAQRGWSIGDWGKDAMPLAGSSTGLAIAERRAVHFPDLADKPDLPERGKVMLREAGGMSVLYAPMLSEDRGVGSIVVSRKPAKPFSDKEIALLQSFADQAAIAIQNTRLFNETQEALEQQKASAEVLGAISKSVADTAPVFETILDACQRLFGSEEIGIYTIGDDDMVRVGAWRGPRAEEARRDVTPLAESVTGRIISERRTHHIPDLGAVPNLSPTLRERVDRHGGASLLYAPMLWEERGLGSILVVRWPPKPFSEREQALLQTFADQAAIAVQNARLFSETQEALEHQKASGEVLRAIAQSVADATPVFENILDASQRLFGTEEVCIFMVGEDGMVRPAAARGPGFSAARNDVMPLEGSRTGRVIRERRVHHIPDGLAEPGTPPALLERMRRSGNVSIAFAPMLWEDSGLGSIAILRSPPRPFSERELELLRGFADQAVIAIQNARMFREVQAKTRDLEESLAQQTATADVLKVISRSVLDLDSVLQTLIDTAVRLAHGSRGTIFIQRGDVLVASAFHSNVPAALREYLATTTWRLDGDTHPARAAREGRVVHVPDLSKLEDKTTQEVRKRAAYGAGLWVPLIGERQTIGVFGVPRDEPVAFTDREIEIVKTFADQAVIAIENARLFEEVRAKTRDLEEALAQQTATADVLKVISRSAFDLQAVFDTLLAPRSN